MWYDASRRKHEAETSGFYFLDGGNADHPGRDGHRFTVTGGKMQHQSSNVNLQWPTNTIIAGGSYLMEDGRVGQVMGVRRTLNDELFLIMSFAEGRSQEVDIMRFDSWTRV